MRFDPDKHHRRSIRLKTYDYSSAGFYFVTFCTLERECILGQIVNGEMQLSTAGQCVLGVGENLPSHYSRLIVDTLIVMPNHVHAILVIEHVGAGLRAYPKRGRMG